MQSRFVIPGFFLAQCIKPRAASPHRGYGKGVRKAESKSKYLDMVLIFVEALKNFVDIVGCPLLVGGCV